MRRKNFEAIRLALFAKSYAGHYFTQHIKASKNPDLLTKNLAKALLFNKNFLAYFLTPEYSTREVDRMIKEITEDKREIEMYLSIESELILLAKAKRNLSVYTDPDYEDESAILSIAIERVAGDSLDTIENDYTFEQQIIELQKIYRTCYYKIARRYRLPTLRIVPFISRLIG
jgi:hypothetical protein